jgi:LPXTG-motif cell wall-anchored protein
MMKKSVLVFSLTMLFILSGINMAKAQEQPKPKKDTVNMDTDAKPQTYYAVEDDNAKPKGNSGTGSVLTLIVVGGLGLVLVGGAVFFFLKKKK